MAIKGILLGRRGNYVADAVISHTPVYNTYFVVDMVYGGYSLCQTETFRFYNILYQPAQTNMQIRQNQ